MLMRSNSILDQGKSTIDFFENILELANLCYYESDLDGLTIYSSQSEAKLLGYDSCNDIKGKINRAELWVDPKLRELFLSHLFEHDRVDKYHCYFRKKNGENIWIEVTSFFVMNKLGRKLLVGFYHEVTSLYAIKIYREKILIGNHSLKNYFNSLLLATSELFESQICSYWNYNSSYKNITLRNYRGFKTDEIKNICYDINNSLIGEFIKSNKKYELICNLGNTKFQDLEFASKYDISCCILIAIDTISNTQQAYRGVLFISTSLNKDLIKEIISEPLVFEISLLLDRALLREQQIITRRFSELDIPQSIDDKDTRYKYLKKVCNELKSYFVVETTVAIILYEEDEGFKIDMISSNVEKITTFSSDLEEFQALNKEFKNNKYKNVKIYFSNYKKQNIFSKFAGNNQGSSFLVAPIFSHNNEKIYGYFILSGKKLEGAEFNKYGNFSEETADIMITISKIVDIEFERIINQENRIKILRRAAHAFKSPTKDILASSQKLLNTYNFLRKGMIDDEYYRILNNIKNRAEKIDNLSHHVLGRKIVRIKQQRFSLERIIRKTLQEKYPIMRTREIPINNATYSGFQDIYIYASQEDFSEIFDNLLTNSIKYYSEPASDFFISVTAFADHDNNLKISFMDNGIGISKKDRSKIFDWGYRGENAEDKDNEGFGIGLHSIKEILSIYNGTIEIQKFGRISGEEETEFIITLPAEIKYGNIKKGDI